MPIRPAVATLPDTVKAWLDRALLDNGFAEYEALSAALGDKGFTISKSALQRYGAGFERSLSKLKLAKEMAEAVVAASPDDQNTLNEALSTLWQHKALDALISLEDDDVEIGFKGLGEVIAKMSGATVAQKRYRSNLKQAVTAKLAAHEAAAVGNADKLQMLAEIRRDIYGIVDAG